MNSLSFFLVCLVLLFSTLSPNVAAQDESRVFSLPEAQVGKSYRADIAAVLREKYRLKLQATAQESTFVWAFAGGELPVGLALDPHGTIIGKPEAARDNVFRFVLRVWEESESEALRLTFSIQLKASGLKLTKIDGPEPKLILADVETTDASQAAQRGPRWNDASEFTARSGAGLDTIPPENTVAAPAISWHSTGASNDNFLEAEKTLEVTVNDSKREICLLNVVVQDRHKQVMVDRKIKVDYNSEFQTFKIGLGKGKNDISVSAWKKKGEIKECTEETNLGSLAPAEDDPLTLAVNCTGKACGKMLEPAAKANTLDPFSGVNNRFLVGIQQSGASSAASDASPFFDFFFRPRHPNARFAMWGDVRLTSTPQQVAAFVSSATNTATAVTGTKLNDFVSSFDFKFGPELQINPTAKSTRFALIGGFGATSPLTTPSQSTEIFKVPEDKSSQAESFFKEYPEAVGHKYIAFVPPERDRFFRQYFLGLRIKSYHFNAQEEPDQFPSMLDLTFGQNSAVTGGQLRHFVFGIDGSYQLPFKGIYIFGSTNLKVGGSKTSKTPFVLDPVDASQNIKLSNPDVVITSRQLNRDVYRLGLGVDLVELFRKDKKSEP